MPSVSIVGELVCVHDFKEQNLFCKYEFVHDDMGKQYVAVLQPGAPALYACTKKHNPKQEEAQPEETSFSVCPNCPLLPSANCSFLIVSASFLVSLIRYWTVVEGKAKGQTQLDVAAKDGEGTWAHPIDIVYSCCSLRGWPKLKLEIWHQDEYQRAEIGMFATTLSDRRDLNVHSPRHLFSAVANAFL